MPQKSNIILKDWIENQPAKLIPYIKNQLYDNLSWTPDILYNKLSGRTAITRAECILINTIFNENIFTVQPVQKADLINY